MKFLVFSDSHEYTNGMDRAIESHKDIKHIIHCGDVEADVSYLEYVYGATHSICAVCGNNDYAKENPFSRIIPVKGHRIYVSHGHKEHVKQTTYTIAQIASNEKCDVAIFGHTHTQYNETKNGFILLNPGSIGYFRHEYAILEVQKDKVYIQLKKI